MGKAKPKVTLGDAVTGEGGDSTRTALGKYNIHSHSTASGQNFLSLGIRPGDSVAGGVDDSEDFTDIVPAGTTVIQLTQSEILLSNPAKRSATEVVMVFGGNRSIGYLQTQQGSEIVTTQGTRGFADGGQLPAYSSETLSGTIISPQAIAYPVVLNAPWGGAIHQLSVMCSSGQADCTLQVNHDSSFSLTQVGTTVQSDQPALTATSKTGFVPGDNIFLALSNIQAGTVFHYTLYLAKTVFS